MTNHANIARELHLLNEAVQAGVDAFARQLATKQDVEQTGDRIIKAITEVPSEVERAAMRLQKALDKLDATIPDKT